MARKSVNKSKSISKLKPKKYQIAGFNTSTYNQVLNPYYVSGTYAEQAAQEADKFYEQAIKFGDYAATSDIRAEQAKKEREQAKKDAIAEAQIAKQQEMEALQESALNVLGSEGVAASKDFFTKKLAEKAAKKAAEETAKSAVTTAGTTAASAAVNPATNTIAQGIAPTITAQAARGSGMEAARVAAEMIDDTGAVVLPGQVATTAGGEVAKTAATAGAGAVGAGSAGLLATNISGLTSAGIGLGLTGAGMLVQRKMDTDPTKFDRREGRQNVWGDALKSAGSGFSMGAAAGAAAGTVVPGIGNLAGGIIGGLAGAAMGIGRGLKENKESKKYAEEYAAEEARLLAEEKKRKALLDKQASEIAQNYNTAFLDSRLTGLQTGFGYNTSTNMNMQPTSSFYGKTGGKLPGGHVVPIGEDAVKFIGRKHSEGGIKLDPQTEVEGGETMDKVMMKGGKPNDYFFSAYLKLGGKSFAKRHEELVAAGASQKEIQELAKKQEAVANKKGEKDRGPEQIAKYGGIHKYKMAGPEESAMAQSNADAKNVTLRDANKANAKAPKDQQSAAPGKLTTNSGMTRKYDTGGPLDYKTWESQSPEERYASAIDAGFNEEEARAYSEVFFNRISKDGPRFLPSGAVQSTSSPIDYFLLGAGQGIVRGMTSAAGAITRNLLPAPSGAKPNTTVMIPESTNSSAPLVVVGGNAKPNTAALIKPGSQSVGRFTGNLGRPKASNDAKVVYSTEVGPFLGKRGSGIVIDIPPVGPRPGFPVKMLVQHNKKDQAKKAANFEHTAFTVLPKDKAAEAEEETVVEDEQGGGGSTDGGGSTTGGGTIGGGGTTTTTTTDSTLTIPTAGETAGAKDEVDTATGDKEKAEKGETTNPPRNKKINGAIIAGIGQLAPLAYVLKRPYRPESKLERIAGTVGGVGATSVKGATIGRVNMNAERAAAERNTVALKNMIQNSNAGPGGIAAMMAANTAQATQLNTIANQEQEANKRLAAEEATLGQQASMANAEMAQRADMANLQNQLEVNKANLEASIQEAKMKIDEKRYKREEEMGALDTFAGRVANIYKDDRSYKSQERLANAMDDAGSYARFQYYEDLKKQAKNKDSEFYGKTDKELRDYAAQQYNDWIGTAKTGGARRYTTRLGELTRGRKKFKI